MKNLACCMDIFWSVCSGETLFELKVGKQIRGSMANFRFFFQFQPCFGWLLRRQNGTECETFTKHNSRPSWKEKWKVAEISPLLWNLGMMPKKSKKIIPSLLKLYTFFSIYFCTIAFSLWKKEIFNRRNYLSFDLYLYFQIYTWLCRIELGKTW